MQPYNSIMFSSSLRLFWYPCETNTLVGSLPKTLESIEELNINRNNRILVVIYRTILETITFMILKVFFNENIGKISNHIFGGIFYGMCMHNRSFKETSEKFQNNFLLKLLSNFQGKLKKKLKLKKTQIVVLESSALGFPDRVL